MADNGAPPLHLILRLCSLRPSIGISVVSSSQVGAVGSSKWLAVNYLGLVLLSNLFYRNNRASSGSAWLSGCANPSRYPRFPCDPDWPNQQNTPVWKKKCGLVCPRSQVAQDIEAPIRPRKAPNAPAPTAAAPQNQSRKRSGIPIPCKILFT